MLVYIESKFSHTWLLSEGIINQLLTHSLYLQFEKFKNEQVGLDAKFPPVKAWLQSDWLQSSTWRISEVKRKEKDREKDMGDRLKQIREKSKLRRQILAQQVGITYFALFLVGMDQGKLAIRSCFILITFSPQTETLSLAVVTLYRGPLLAQ